MIFSENRFTLFRIMPHALVAQLDRASDFDSEGREFESLRARHFGTSTPEIRRFCARAATSVRSSAPFGSAMLDWWGDDHGNENRDLRLPEAPCHVCR